MAVNLSPYGGVGAQFLDNSGNVLTGGKIYTYAAGTTTPQATYTTSAGFVFHPNPIILDASGRVPSGGEIWLTDGLLYKFVLETSTNVLIATYDNIAGINSNFVNFTNEQEIQTATAGQTVFTLATVNYQVGTNSLSVFVDGVNQYGPGAQYAYLETNSTTVTFINGLHVGALVKFTTSQLNSSGATAASQVSFTGFKSQTGTVQSLASGTGSDWIGFTQAGTGAVAISAQDKMRQFISAADFGAVCNGVTDDTAAIQTAVNYCIANKKDLLMPGISYITASINIDRLVDSLDADWYFTILSSSQGGFYVNTPINMFSTTLTNGVLPVSQMIRWQNIVFNSATAANNARVLDGNKFLRIQFNGCSFTRIRCLETTRLVQSIYFFNCNMRRWAGVFFNCRNANYDVKFIGNIAENGDQFVLMGTATANQGPIGCSFIGNLIEGMNNYGIQYATALGLAINGNYFETNGIDIDGRNLGGTSIGVAVTGNFYSHPPSPNPYGVLWGDCSGCISMGNAGLTSINDLSATSKVQINDAAQTGNVSNKDGVASSGYGQATWAPVFRGGNTTNYTYTVTSANFTRNGQQVTYMFKGTMTSTATNASETFFIPSQLPWTNFEAGDLVGQVQIVSSGGTVYSSPLISLTTSNVQSTGLVIPANVLGDVFTVRGQFSFLSSQVTY